MVVLVLHMGFSEGKPKGEPPFWGTLKKDTHPYLHSKPPNLDPGLTTVFWKGNN